MPRFAIAALLPLALLGAAPAGTPGTGCPASVQLAAPEARPGALPHVAAAVKAGALDVLAIGSGSLLGLRGRPQGSFPDVMAQTLREALPRTEIRLRLQGERGMTAAAMLAALRKDLASHPAQLVIWQTGTVEAVRKLPPDQFARDLADGAAAVRQAGGDLVLVDPQYSRMLQSHASLPPYRDAMRKAAEGQGALLFDRFDLIRHWAEQGDLDLERAPKPERLQTKQRLDGCLGEALAAAVLRGAALQAAR